MNITDASKEIAKILSKLEIDTGCIVAGISLSEIEVTTMSDDRPIINKSVVIDLERTPGSDWST